ncbi:MAG: hypothetical protein ACN6OP_17165 [Pseudomonadales bacterium]
MDLIILFVVALLALAFILIDWVIPEVRKFVYQRFFVVFRYVFPDGNKENDEQFEKLREGMSSVAVKVTFLIILVLLISVGLSVVLPEDENKLTGPLGDLFNGLLAPILTFLTFCGLLVTIFIQQHQLKLTIHEFELSRQENAKSTEALEGQLRNLAAQKFDGNFYSLLQKQENITAGFLESGIDFKWNSLTMKEIDSGRDHSYQWSIEKDQYLKFFLINFRILDYISFEFNNGVIGQEEARRYRNIVRAMTPNQFLELLLINCQQDDHRKYKKYLIDSKYFEHFSFGGKSPEYFSKLFSSWPLSSFGDKKRITEYFVNNKHKVINFLMVIPMAEDSIKSSLESKRWMGRMSAEDVQEVTLKIRNVKDEFFKKLSCLNIEKICDDERLFSAFLDGDGLHFLRYLNSDTDFFEDYKNFLAIKKI